MELHSSSSFSLMAKRLHSLAKELAWIVKLCSSILGCSIMVAITSSVRLSFLCVPASLVRSARKCRLPVYCMYGCTYAQFHSQPCVCVCLQQRELYILAVIIELLFTVTIIVWGDHVPAEEPMTSKLQAYNSNDTALVHT